MDRRFCAAQRLHICFLLFGPARDDSSESGFALGLGVTIALELILAVALYIYAPRSTRKLDDLGAGTNGWEDRLEIGALALRLMGILIVDGALGQATRIVTSIAHPAGIDDTGERLIAIAVTLVLLALGVVFVWRARAIARVMFKTGAPREVAASELAQAIAFSSLGVWFVVGSLPEVLEGLFDAWRAHPATSFFGLGSARAASPFFVHVFRCAAGIVLFVSAAKIARAWHRLRTAGLPESMR